MSIKYSVTFDYLSFYYRLDPLKVNVRPKMRESERREDTLDEREQEKERVTPVLCFQYSMHLKESKNPLQISRANVIASAFRLKCHMNSN